MAMTELRRSSSLEEQPPIPGSPILLQAAFGNEHCQLLEYTQGLHAEYCARHGITYQKILRPPPAGRPAHWTRVEVICELLANGVNEIAWLDTDCVIVDPTYNLFDASGYGIAVCECYDSPDVERHLNTGFMIVTRSAEVCEFMATWAVAPAGGKWEDQSAFIDLMAPGQANRDILTILPNRFNCVARHMEARDPFIRAFHGDPQRMPKIASLVASLKEDRG